MQKLVPFLKWAGGKRQLLPVIERLIPQFKRYYEPFLGGGAVLLHLKPEVAVVNDINPFLVNAWKQVRDDLKGLVEILEYLDKKECNEFTYAFLKDEFNDRIEDNSFGTESAALFIWVNKHCFNGLYRVNRHGMFNVPWNRKTKCTTFSYENLKEISEYLRNSDVEFLNGDYEDALAGAGEGDFAFIDPPYVPASATAGFTSYAKGKFDSEEHLRVSLAYARLAERNVKALLTNNDVPMARDLYRDFNIVSVDALRSINSKGNARKGKEIIVRNWKDEREI